MTQKYYTFDKELVYREPAQSALSADGYVGTQKNMKGAVLTELVMVINIESLDITTGDELYTFRVVGSETADRSDARVLATHVIGLASAKTIDTVDDAAGDQIVMRFATELNGVNFQYLDLHLDVAGTTPSIAFSAYASKHE